ncbi:SRPBCC domain-containing protein [Agrobacterium tumefaciens]|uniref:SRPBCC family protein n=1 Tax=Agrobacterium tumefaciens TaxID=358 RepID=UPI000DCF9B90|nr:SRPBCC domain-containing protein [Agrobacterium tumefaciens]WCK14430.1 SRPBCC domain-containing protein [Agrobacterium tumefaciens]
MNRELPAAPKPGIELEYDLDEPPQKVWRAISIPAFREHWLPKEALAEPEAIRITPGKEVCYRMRDDVPPFLESTVTFRIASNASGGTSLRVIHELPITSSGRMTKAAANHNRSPIKLAA